ncbi:class F sortase [Mariniluteicoccus flavus]
MAAPAAPAGWATAAPPAPRTPATAGPRAGPPALEVPSLAIRARVVAADVVAGEYAVPRDPGAVGAYRPGGGDLAARLAPRPGVLLVAGHVTVGRERGSLWPLHTLAPGAELITTSPGGTRRWKAVRLDVHRADALPADLTRAIGPERLVVVTCTGPVITSEGRRAYRDNLVVTAVPA